MSKILLFIFSFYLAVLWAPLGAMAEETEVGGICPFGIGVDEGTFTEEQLKVTYKTYYETFDTQMQEALQASKDNETEVSCGTPNTYTNFLEKGDCSAEGLVVTELTEVFAPEVELKEGDKENQVITVYAGVCCMAGEIKDGKVTTCNDTRTIYTTSYSDCTAANAQNCEKRQWVIGTTGISIVKLMVKQIFAFAALAVGSVCVSTIVLQAIKISVSGVSGDISEAKNKILQAIGGMVLFFLSGLFLYAINPEFFG